MIIAMDVSKWIGQVTCDRRYRGQIVHVETIPPRQACYGDPARPIAPQLKDFLAEQMGIERLYTHQARAMDAVAAGQDVVVVTATASGKTLCYNLPVVQTLLAEPNARALYLFPTKALTQDQCGTLNQWARNPEIGKVLYPAVYDGDTPSHTRTKIRNKASVVLTNPDMLHVGMLPYHTKWHAFLRNLRYIVLDELHTYRGIFGSHVAGVLRRLLRICAHYGSSPQIISSSATIANPLELGETLTGREMTLIDNDGSPRGRKHFVLWNPPFVGQEEMFRRSANVEAVGLLQQLIPQNVQTIVFTKSRVATELIYKYAAQDLDATGQLGKSIRPYRGGYLPSERRAIEKDLFSGKLMGVVATNALELGIDVGQLDAAVLVGFPGTICSTWQQAGRAGRSSNDSLVVLIGHDDPVDQYLMRHPKYLFGATHEHSVIDPGNPHILAAQLSCACFEKPLSGDDREYFGDLIEKVAEICSQEGEMKEIDGRHYWSSTEFPARNVNLRLISSDTYAISDTSRGGKVIGQVDSISAPELVYPQAVYLHEGQSYLVEKLDMETKVAAVAPCEVDYYTQPVLASSCRLGEGEESQAYQDGEMFFGAADVTWQTTAFRKMKYYTMEMIGQSELDLPSQTLSTTAMWWTVSEEMRKRLSKAGHNPIEALMGVRNLMLAALPSLAMCDRRDISGMVDSANLGIPTVMVYDRYPGGLGYALQGYEMMDVWLDMCTDIVAGCPCQEGCPSCVGLANLRPPIHHDPDISTNMPVPSKPATMVLLKLLGKLNR